MGTQGAPTDNLTTNSMKPPPWGEVKGEKEKKENGLKL